MSAARDTMRARLAGYDVEDLRAIIELIARRDLYGVITALDQADWHINHGDVCAEHIAALEQHTTRALQRLAADATRGAPAVIEVEVHTPTVEAGGTS